MGIYSVMNGRDKSTSDYRNYIIEHKENVLKAFNQFKDTLQNYLDFDIDELSERVSNHDMSKFGPEEFDQYRQFFYPAPEETPNEDLMNHGWLHHIHYNEHHWEYWIIPGNDSKVLDMPDLYIAEMLLDWAAMGIKFNSSAKDWYVKNSDNIIISEKTRGLIDRVIDQF